MFGHGSVSNNFGAATRAGLLVSSSILRKKRKHEQRVRKVNHPDHYQSERIETIDVIEAFRLNFSLGSAVKYILRERERNLQRKPLKTSVKPFGIYREIERRNNEP